MTIKNKFTAVYKNTKNWVIAWVEEIPGVNTHGKTLKEARENLQKALFLVIEENRNISRLFFKKSPSIRREHISVTLSV